MSTAPRKPWPVRAGDFLFRFRNALGPGVLVLALAAGTLSPRVEPSGLDAWFRVAGVLVALLGQGVRVLTIGLDYIERGGRERRVYASRLVQGGVFAHCRNPLYLGNILICLGLVLVAHSWALYLLVLPFVLLAYACIVAAEEAFLRARFGFEYEDYCRRVPRWWPRRGEWRRSVQGMRFQWARVLVKEYNTLFLLPLAIALLLTWTEYRASGIHPRGPSALTALALWLCLYVAVRALKKNGILQDSAPEQR